ncbi:MAG: inosine/xanthosine triphosphatase [Anaerolineaceae bacterium]|nr:inosine/xanthosine triphosphatase [Anaerolineaceae bacterium]MDD4043682.1 inosine/xanthosine triphosphatase [Anaerolineaceae bacterium]MDD4578055.1 inosine/xanthosine triphosphatase [Anaerolineaceae bacterium]
MAEIVVIGSENPSKLQAVQLGFRAVFPEREFIFLTAEVSSDVTNQPMSDAETLKGARNRAANARQICPQANYWVGLEGGLSTLNEADHSLAAYSWVAILGKQRQGFARSASYLLPEKVAVLIRGGMEQGEADDIVFGQENSKHTSGGVGLLTNDLITRAELYAMAVKLALIPFIQQALYPVTPGN